MSDNGKEGGWSDLDNDNDDVEVNSWSDKDDDSLDSLLESLQQVASPSPSFSAIDKRMFILAF